MVATSSAYARTQAHKSFPTAAKSLNLSLKKAQRSSIASSLKNSVGLKPSQLTTKNYCDKPSKGHVTCDLQVLAVKHTHQLVHPHVTPERLGASHLLAPRSTNLDAVGVTPDTAPASSSEPTSGTPAWLQQAYDTTWLSANKGSGETVAIVDAYDDPTAASDLATYRAYFGLPACTTANGCFTEINQSGQTQAQATSWPAANSSWNMEESMDLDAVSALCPNCHIVYVEANSSAWSDLNTAETAAENHSGVNVISDSFGMMEKSALATGAFNDASVTIVASTGDNGYESTSGPQYPAALTNVVAAGGTSLSTGSVSGSRGFSETAWDGSGSACDTYESKPSWQRGACSGRATADVSADADPNTGIALYNTSGGGWNQAGGTSLSSPLIAAFEALTAPSTKTGQWAYTDASLLNDITSGSNDTVSSTDLYGTCTTSLIYLCNARTGFDGPTGNGSISGEIATGGPGLGGPDVCAGSSCTSGSEGYESASTSTTATLNANVYANGLATTYYWQYGTSTSFGSQSTSATTAATTAPVAVSSTLSGLTGGTTYYYRLVATNADGTVYGYTFSFGTGAVPNASSVPTITGDATQGSTLTANVGSWTQSPTSYSYQWQRNTGGGFTNISGATASTYTLGTGDVAGTLDVVVTAKNATGSGSATSASTSAVVSEVPVDTAAPSISSAGLTEGVALTAVVGTWTPANVSYGYQWQRDTGDGFTDIGGATDAKYTPGTNDVGASIRVLVTGKNSYGSAQAVGTISGTVTSSAPVNMGAPAISGIPKRTDTLSVTAGTWSATATITYQWNRCARTCSAISGATKSSYVAVAADEGDGLKVVVTATNSYGTAQATTTATPSIAAFLPANAAKPTISGTAKKGGTLTAHLGTWIAAGPKYTYQWESCSRGSCSAIRGATTSTHKLTSADAGKTIEVQVTNVNVDGATSKLSRKTATVRA